MNNNILFSINYNQDIHQCVGTTHSLMNQTIGSEIVSIFPHSQHKDFYESYFNQYNNNLIKFICNPNNNLLINDIYHKYLPKYNWFAFLSPYILYNKNFTEELLNICSQNSDEKILSISSYNDDSKIFKILVYNKNTIIDAIKNEYYIKNLFEEDIIKNKKNIISFSCSCWKDMEQQYLSRQTTYHNDEYSIFVKFIEPKNANLKNSFVYINKLKHRIYNISNNIIGLIDTYENNKIKVLWSIKDGEQIDAKYEFNYNTKSYSRI